MFSPDVWLWVASIVLVLLGLAGTILPALPGPPLIFGGLLLAAWIHDFQRVGYVVVVVLGALTLLTVVLDVIAAMLGAKRVGATSARRGVLSAGRVAAGTWVALLIAVVVKLAVAFAMIGLFVLAYVL